MKGEIDNNFYCTGRHCACFPDDCDAPYCEGAHCKWPTPEQYKAEYGEEYPEDGAVYVHNSGWGWMVETYKQAKARLINVPETEMVCACTPWGRPPDDWRPA